MTIKFYPSRLPGEPLETHEHGVLTLHEWMSRNVPSYSQDKTHPVVIVLNGQAVPPGGMAVMFVAARQRRADISHSVWHGS